MCAELGLDIVPHGISFERRRTAHLPAPTPEEYARVIERAHARTAERLERDGEDFALVESFEPPSSRSAIEEAVVRRLETFVDRADHESQRSVVYEPQRGR